MSKKAFSLNVGAATSDETSQNFAHRCADVFAQLGDAPVKSTPEKTTSPPRDRSDRDSRDNRDNRDRKASRDQMEAFRGAESIFRVPEDVRDRDRRHHRAPDRRHRKRKAPDHQLHPEKYTKYSLADVPGVTDRSNSRAAFDFLRELRDKKNAGSKPDLDQELGDRGKITFKKPPRQHQEEKEKVSAASGSGKFVLPEVSVGQKPRSTTNSLEKIGKSEKSEKSEKTEDKDKAKKRKTKTTTPVLSHLAFEDPEEDD